MTATFRIDQNGVAGTAGVSRQDLVVTLPITLHAMDVSTTYLWEVVSSPEGSAHVLTNATSRDATLVLTTTGGCLVRLTVDNALPTKDIARLYLGVPLQYSDLCIPAFNETDEDNSLTGEPSGYERKITAFFKWMDTVGSMIDENDRVRVSATDEETGLLSDKIAAGENISLAILNPGGNEVLQITSTGGGGGTGIYKTTCRGAVPYFTGYLPAGTVVDNTYTATADGSINDLALDDITTYAVGDRLLITRDSASGLCGIWEITDTGSPTAPLEMQRDSSLEELDQAIWGSLVHVVDGTRYGGTTWRLRTASPASLDDVEWIPENLFSQYVTTPSGDPTGFSVIFKTPTLADTVNIAAGVGDYNYLFGKACTLTGATSAYNLLFGQGHSVTSGSTNLVFGSTHTLGTGSSGNVVCGSNAIVQSGNNFVLGQNQRAGIGGGNSIYGGQGNRIQNGYASVYFGNGNRHSIFNSGTQISFSKSGSIVTLTDTSAPFTSAMTGRSLIVSGATTSGNNGTFTITYVSTTQVQYTNASGATEAGVAATTYYLNTGQQAYSLVGGNGVFGPSLNCSVLIGNDLRHHTDLYSYRYHNATACFGQYNHFTGDWDSVLVAGDSNTLGTATAVVVGGKNHTLVTSSGALTYSAVFGYGHTVGGSLGYALLAGQENTVGGASCDHSVILGYQFTCGAGCAGNLIAGYQNTFNNGNGSQYNLLVGSANSVSNSCTGNAVFGATNALAFGAGGASYNVVGGTTHTLGSSTIGNAVFGTGHILGNGATQNAVFGNTNTAGYVLTRSLVAGGSNTVGNYHDSVYVFGVSNTITASTLSDPVTVRNHLVIGYNNSVGADLTYVSIYGASNTVTGGASTVYIWGASNTVQDGSSSSFLVGSSNSITQGSGTARVFGSNNLFDSGGAGIGLIVGDYNHAAQVPTGCLIFGRQSHVSNNSAYTASLGIGARASELHATHITAGGHPYATAATLDRDADSGYGQNHGLAPHTGQTTNATPTEIYMNGADASKRYPIPERRALTLMTQVVAFCSTTGGVRSWNVYTTVKTEEGGSATLVGTPIYEPLHQSAEGSEALWDVAVGVTSRYLTITVTGATGEVVNWQCCTTGPQIGIVASGD